MAAENWRTIPGYEGRYSVSDLGRVRGARVVLKGQVTNAGYRVVNLYTEGERRVHLVHRLVAEVFIPHVEWRDRVNHKNGNKLDCTLHNLEWCTSGENAQHAYDTGLRAPPSHRVEGTHLRTGAVVVFSSQRDAERALSQNGKQSSALNHVFTGKKKSAYGYAWRKL